MPPAPLPEHDETSSSSSMRARLALAGTALLLVAGLGGVGLVHARMARRAEAAERAAPAGPATRADERDAGAPLAQAAVDDDAGTAALVPTVSPSDLPLPAGAARPARPPPRHAGACDPPYTVDADGMRHFKPECL